MASTDYVNRMREYRKLLSLCGSPTAVSSKRTPVLVRDPLGKSWYPTLLVSQYAGLDHKVNVLQLDTSHTWIDVGLFGPLPPERGYPEVSVSRVDQDDVRLLPHRPPELEKLLAAVDAYCPKIAPASADEQALQHALTAHWRARWEGLSLLLRKGRSPNARLAAELPVLNLATRWSFLGRRAERVLE